MRPFRTAWELASLTVRSAWNNRILGLSAEAAFWQLLSLPSLFLALLATTGYVSRWLGGDTVERARTELLDGFSRAFSDEVVTDLIAPTVNDVLTEGRAEVISIGFVIALWAGSSATATFVNTVTIAYGMRELRGAVRSRLLALWLYLGSVCIGVVVLPLLVLGPRLITDMFPKGEARDVAGRVISNAYWPAAVALLLLGLASFYRLAPPRRFPWHRGLPGAFLAMLVFLAGSAGLREYVTFIVAHGYTYGRLAAPIAALLFFYVLALGVLLGAEFNAAIEHTWPSKRRMRLRRWQTLPPTGQPTATRATSDDSDADGPDSGRPVSDRPDSDRPDADRPDSDRPDADRPDSDRPDAHRPDADRPDGNRPDGEAADPTAGSPAPDPSGESQPGESQPGESQPGESQPGDAQPGESQPGDAQPGDAQPGESQPGESQPEGSQSDPAARPSGGALAARWRLNRRWLRPVGRPAQSPAGSDS